MTARRRHVLVLAAAAVTFAALAGCQKAAPAHKFNAVDLTGAAYARQFDLPDFNGKPRTLADFKGKVVVVFFGYTQCPDACPTTMTELAQVQKLLGPDGARVQVLFITVDPERDTAQLLKSYVTNFNPGFLALRGDTAQVKAVTREFKVFYEKVPGSTPGNYTIDHTAGTYVFDPEGRVRLFARSGMPPEQLADDVKALLAEKA